MFLGTNTRSFGLTVADFTYTGNCYGDQTNLNSSATSSYTIISLNWDIDSDGVFTDAVGANVTYLFSYADSFRVGLQVITSNDTVVIYKDVLIQLITPYFTINADSQCLSGNKFVFTNSTSIFPLSGTFTNKWYFGDATTDTILDPFHSYLINGRTFTVKLVTTTNMGCKDSSTELAVVLPNPRVTFKLDTINCIGKPFTFTNTSRILYGTFTNQWDFGDGGTSTAKDTTYAYSSAGYFTVTLKATSNNGCIDSVKHNLFVDTNLHSAFKISPNDTQCVNNNSFTFINSSNVCGTLDSISWDLNGDTIFGDQIKDTVLQSYLTPQTVRIGMIIYSGIKSDTVYHFIVISPAPVASFTIDFATQNITGNLFNYTNNSTITPVSSLTYKWNFGDGGNSVAVNPAYSYLKSGIFRVNLTAKSDKGCIDSISKYDTIVELLNVNFTADSVCLFDSTTFINTTTSSDTIKQINWDFNNDSIFTDTSGNNVKHLFLVADTFIVGLQIVTPGRTDTIFKRVIVHPKPVAGFNVNTPIQFKTGNNFIFTNTSTITAPDTISNYLWDFNDATTSTLKDDNHNYIDTGNYSVILKVTSQYGCTDTISHKVSVIPDLKLIADFISDSVCYPSVTTLTNTSISTNPILQLNWDLDSNGLFDNDTGQLVKFTFSGGNSFPVGLQVITSTDTTVIYKHVIVYSKPIADFSINLTPQPLTGNNFIFTNASTIVPASTLSYSWDFGNGGVSKATDTNYSYSTAGFFTVQLIAISDKGCSDTISKQVNIISYTLSVDFSVNNACLGDSTKFSNLSTETGDSMINFKWDFGDGITTIVRGNPHHLYSTAGNYNVTLTVLLLSGNKDSLVKSITIYPSPIVNITATDSIIYQGQSAKLIINGTFDSIIWSTGSNDTIITVSSTGIYSVKVIDINGCKDSTSKQILVLQKTELQTVSTFTPNGDGINDNWKILNIETFGKCEVKIFNRWGDLIYTSSDYKNDWNGTRNGKQVPEGTYYYLIKTPKDGAYTAPLNILK
jgi:gliding motility-associated-like protein